MAKTLNYVSKLVIVAEVVPLKQGLKHDVITQYKKSNVYVAEVVPLKQGLKPSSAEISQSSSQALQR